MIEEIILIMEALLKNDKFFEVSAQMLKKMHVALIKAGFTEEEALRIVAGQGSGF